MQGLRSTVTYGVLGVIFSALSIGALAQVNNYINFTVDDGLPSNEVYHVIEDEQGYIWFATDRGVSRFNGYEFENLSTQEGLHNNVIFQLFEDTLANRIWCMGLGNAISCIDLDDRNIRRFDFPEAIQTGRQTDKYIYGARNDTVELKTDVAFWILVTNDSSKITSYTKKWKDPLTKGTQTKNALISGVWVKESSAQPKESDGYRVIIDGESVVIPRTQDHFIKDIIFDFSLTQRFHLWRVERLFLFDRMNSTVSPLPLKSILGVYLEGKKLEVLTPDGLYQMIIDSVGQPTLVPERFFQNKGVTALTNTEDGSRWVCTREEGVFFLKNLQIKNLTVNEGLEKNAVKKLEPFDKNRFLLSYYGPGVLGVYNQASGVLENFEVYGGEIEYMAPLCQDTVLLSHAHNSLLFNTRTKEVVDLNVFGIMHLYHKPTRDLWMHRFCRVGKLGRQGTIDSSGSFGYYSEGNTTDEHMYVHRDTIWCGGIFGFGYIDENKKWKSDPRSDEPIGRVKGMDGFSHRYLAIATLGNGLFIKKGSEFLHIEEEQGLISNITNAVTVDEYGGAWVSTNSGLSHVKFSDSGFTQYEITNYTSSTGLISNQVNDVVRIDSLVWVATAKGLNVINLNESIRSIANSRMVISNLNSDDRKLDSEFDGNLEYREGVEIQYLSVDIKKLGNITYEYRMLGLDDVWRKTTSRSVRFPKLEDGEYTFEVRVFDPIGRAEMQVARQSFSVSSPFWKTWWFWIVAGTVVVAIVRYRFTQLQDKARLETELLDTRRQALASQMNPHFLFNSFNSIRNFVLQNDKHKADEYIVRFSELTRSILNNSFKETITLQQELDMIENYLDIERMRVHNKFDYQIHVAPSVAADYIEIPPAVLHPFVENAVWHGVKELSDKQGKIDVRCFKESSYLVCQIQDNGKGFNESPKKDPRKHKSFGIDITKQRLELVQTAYQQQVHVDVSTVQKNGAVAGVVVTLKFKLEHGS